MTLGCNMGAAAARRLIGGCAVMGLLAAGPSSAAAQHAQVAQFLAGGAIGLAMHEAGHLALGISFNASPGVRGVRFGPIPFFAITHDPVSPAREFAISSAGFWVQHASSEVILSRRPRLRGEQAPIVKGILAFNVLASVAYAGAAFGRVGPDERDTRGMAASARIAEPWVGALILGPAALDAARYFHPDAAWLKWMSRVAKVGGVLLIVKAAGGT